MKGEMMAVSDGVNKVYLTKSEMADLASFIVQSIQGATPTQLFSIKAVVDERIDRIIVYALPETPAGAVKTHPLQLRSTKRTG